MRKRNVLLSLDRGEGENNKRFPSRFSSWRGRFAAGRWPRRSSAALIVAGVVTLLSVASAAAIPAGYTPTAAPAPSLSPITSFPMPASSTTNPFGTSPFPFDMTTGPDGNLWFTNQQANNVGRMNPRDPSDVTFFPIPTPNSKPLKIRRGSGGDLWFSEVTGNKIARITTAGAITEFPVPTPNSQPRDIAVGPDGAVWFTEVGNLTTPQTPNGKVGRMLPYAPYTITEFPVPSVPAAAAIAADMTLGPDGNFWFDIDFGTNPAAGPGQIGRILSHAPYTITEFPLPSGSTGATDITRGPDGNLWFTDTGGKAIGRLSPIGSDAAIRASMTEFPVSPATQLLNITAGPDGNMWFTDTYGNALGRILTKAPNTVTVFPGPTGVHTASLGPIFINGVAGITAGSDGNLWVTEEFAGKIGRFDMRRGDFDPAGLPDLSGLTQLAFGGPFVRERPIQTPATDPAMVVTDGQGNEWFTESTANKIARIDHRTHALTEFPIPTPATNPFGLSLGHDGNIWFAEQGQLNSPGGAPTGNIGRILTTAPYTITEFPLGAGSGANGYITSGVDGNLWFGEVQLTGTTFSYTIDRMSPTAPNTVTKFHTKTRGAIPLGFTSGTDGGIWYPVRLPASGLSAIARIDPNAPDPQQSILEFLLPPSSEVAADITPGPNGTIWWTQSSGTTSSIGRILTAAAHTITQFPVPPTDVTGSSDATGISQGPDGNMWFTDKDPSKIGRILTGGANTITEYRTPTRFSGPRGITTGPDGSLLFTELGANKIGCIKLNPRGIPLLGDLLGSCE